MPTRTYAPSTECLARLLKAEKGKFRYAPMGSIEELGLTEHGECHMDLVILLIHYIKAGWWTAAWFVGRMMLRSRFKTPIEVSDIFKRELLGEKADLDQLFIETLQRMSLQDKRMVLASQKEYTPSEVTDIIRRYTGQLLTDKIISNAVLTFYTLDARRLIEDAIREGHIGTALTYQRLSIYRKTDALGRLLTIFLQGAHKSDLAMAWLTASNSYFQKKIRSKGFVTKPAAIECVQRLKIFGIAHSCEGGFEDDNKLINEAKQSSRSQVVKVLGRMDVSWFLFQLPFNPMNIDDGVYMCMYHGMLDQVKRILNRFHTHIKDYPLALHWAVRSRKLQCIKYVLKYDSTQLNQRCELGFTPLMLAVFTGKKKVFDSILEQGPDTEILSRDCRTALDCAQICKYESFIAALPKKREQQFWT